MTAAWDRQPDEPTRWFRRLQAFCGMGPGRSVLAAYKQDAQRKGAKKVATRHAPTAWHDAATAWNWRARADAYDGHQADERERQWQERQLEIRETGWKAAQALIAKAREMIESPLYRTKTDDDGATIMEPARWSFDTASRYIDIAAKLARLSAGLETERQRIDVHELIQTAALEVGAEAGLPPDEIAREAEAWLKAQPSQ